MSVLVAQGAAPAQTEVAAGRRRRFLSGLIHNRKAVIGLAVFLVFSLLAIAPQLFTSVREPNRLAAYPAALGRVS